MQGVARRGKKLQLGLEADQSDYVFWMVFEVRSCSSATTSSEGGETQDYSCESRLPRSSFSLSRPPLPLLIISSSIHCQ